MCLSCGSILNQRRTHSYISFFRYMSQYNRSRCDLLHPIPILLPFHLHTICTRHTLYTVVQSKYTSYLYNTTLNNHKYLLLISNINHSFAMQYFQYLLPSSPILPAKRSVNNRSCNSQPILSWILVYLATKII